MAPQSKVSDLSNDTLKRCPNYLIWFHLLYFLFFFFLFFYFYLFWVLHLIFCFYFETCDLRFLWREFGSVFFSLSGRIPFLNETKKKKKEMLRILVHMLGALQFSYSVYYDWNYVEIPKTVSNIGSAYGGKFKFLTFWDAVSTLTLTPGLIFPLWPLILEFT